MRGNLSKKDYRRVPFRIGEQWAKGYLTVSIHNHELIHLTNAEPYSSPLCEKRGILYDRTLTEDEFGFVRGRFCKTCVDIAERKRMNK